VVIVLVSVAVVPVPHSYGATLDLTRSSFARENFTFPKGAKVTGSWGSTSPTGVTFEILGTPSFTNRDNSSSGSFSFTSTGSTYSFVALGTADPGVTTVQGTYLAPLWS